MDSIEYYNKYAARIFEDTVGLNVQGPMREFLKHLEEGDTVLDLGCGSGRDSLCFYELGYDVTPLDASEELCRLAEIHTGLEVLNMCYEDMEFDGAFDGVWANEALIHAPKEELPGLLKKVAAALRPGGVLYLSFREGVFEGVERGLYYCDFNESRLKSLLSRVEEFQVMAAGTEQGRCFALCRRKKMNNESTG